MNIADVTDRRFTDAQRQHLAAFEGAEAAPEAFDPVAALRRVEALANTLAATAAQCRAEATHAATIGGRDRWEREAKMCQTQADRIRDALAPQAEFTRNEVMVRLDRDIVGDDR